MPTRQQIEEYENNYAPQISEKNIAEMKKMIDAMRQENDDFPEAFQCAKNETDYFGKTIPKKNRSKWIAPRATVQQ